MNLRGKILPAMAAWSWKMFLSRNTVRWTLWHCWPKKGNQIDLIYSNRSIILYSLPGHYMKIKWIFLTTPNRDGSLCWLRGNLSKIIRLAFSNFNLQKRSDIQRYLAIITQETVKWIINLWRGLCEIFQQ